MTDRPIEALIGWSRCVYNDDCGLELPDFWHMPGQDCIGSWCGHRGCKDHAEVDDLAAWLVAQGAAPGGMDWYEDGRYEVWFWPNEGEDEVDGEGSTIRDALVAAVRKVAGEAQ